MESIAIGAWKQSHHLIPPHQDIPRHLRRRSFAIPKTSSGGASGSAELGYWLAEKYWGGGIMTEAVMAFIPVAFEQSDVLRMIHAGIYSNNPASMRVLEKGGLVRESVHRAAIVKDGELLDEAVYVVLRDE